MSDANARLEALVTQLAEAAPDPDGSTEPGQQKEQRDVAILRSLPGVGTGVLATLFAEADDALQRRDYHALRCLCGVAPVTKRSGKSMSVSLRRASHRRLRNATYHWARVAMQKDPRLPGEVPRASLPRPRPRSLVALRRGPPPQRRLRHAPRPDTVRPVARGRDRATHRGAVNRIF